jgi:catechol 2,3-dioxygenase-like lactoylglutathione lyase family enzyme
MKIAKLVPELISSDIERSLKFYTDVLGFHVLFARPEERFAYLEYDGAQLMLEQSTGRRFLNGALEKPYGRGINLQIKTDSVDELYTRVQAAKATIYLPMEEKGYRCDDVYLVSRQFVVEDPDGYLLRFFQDLGARKTEF